jgi:hypothetical protein
MENSREVIVDVDLKPNDVYRPFLWSRENAARWVSAIVISLIVYDLYQRSGETI